jgi:hypothetical protein
MAEGPYKIPRAELAQFLPSPRAIRAFEQLFDIVPGDINAINVEIAALAVAVTAVDVKATTAIGKADAAQATATEALTKVNQLLENIDFGTY